MSKQDYQLLEIENNDIDNNILTLDMVKKAYMKMIIKYHPDRNNNSLESLNKTQMIIKSYKNILDLWNYRKPKNQNISRMKNQNKSDTNLKKKSNSRHFDFEKITKKYFN